MGLSNGTKRQFEKSIWHSPNKKGNNIYSNGTGCLQHIYYFCFVEKYCMLLTLLSFRGIYSHAIPTEDFLNL